MVGTAPRVALDFLGCKVNQAEIEDLSGSFRQAGYAVVDSADAVDVYVLNSCTITHVADRKARLLIRQAARRNPQALIVVTGCYPSVDAPSVQSIPGVGLVVSNADKPRLVDMIRQRLAPSPDRAAPTEPARRSQRTRLMLKVQDGCDHFCTYCIVPRARGGVRSVPIERVIDQVQERVSQGFREIVLTGVALGSYGDDWSGDGRGRALARLVEAILTRTALPRLRLSSIEPENLHPGLLELWSNARFCRHLHLPLQSGCDATLRRMGRRYRQADYGSLVEQARRSAPDVALTTDIIVGFPGESEQEFAESRAFAATMAFAKVHVFRFSARRGTPATRLRQPASETAKKERSAIMSALSDEGAQAHRARFVGRRRSVLWEEAVPGPTNAPPGDAVLWTGLTDNYIRVYLPSAAELGNTVTDVRLGPPFADGLSARVLDEHTIE